MLSSVYEARAQNGRIIALCYFDVNAILVNQWESLWEWTNWVKTAFLFGLVFFNYVHIYVTFFIRSSALHQTDSWLQPKLHEWTQWTYSVLIINICTYHALTHLNHRMFMHWTSTLIILMLLPVQTILRV